ncbi:MAG: ATP-binding protein, partial [Anaerolineae bacterium]
RLLRALTNLVDNAIRHTPEGGIVTLRLEPSPQGVVVRVEDTGPGIPESALPRLFERFYQVDSSRANRQRRGTGLGLAIAHEIVQAHGGTLKAANRPQGGAVFEVHLPLTPPQSSL